MTQDELKALKVKDIIGMDEFRAEMDRQITLENEMYDKFCREAALQKKRVKRTAVDRLREREVYNMEMMVQLFEAVLSKSLVGFSAAEREYIYGIGMLCMGKVLAELKKKVEPVEEKSI